MKWASLVVSFICFFNAADCIPKPQNKPTEKCIVEGNVVRAATGEAMKKARVLLCKVDEAGKVDETGEDETTLHVSMTDEQGHFVMKGSRLRLAIACPNSIQIQKNYNSGGVVANETGKDARTANVTLYHDAKHPSTLELPIVK